MTDLGETPHDDARNGDRHDANGTEAEKPGRRSYHHGHLREALIAATKDLLAEKGPQGFTLADAARIAGVSPAAPYRHFTDREALLREVAAVGFKAFGEALGRAACSGDPASGFRAMGDAYLRFAREEPGYYIAMFSARLPPAPDGVDVGTVAFDRLIEAIVAVLAARKLQVPDLRCLALQVWSLSHGVATLAAAGRLGEDQADAEEILASGVRALLDGAGR
jgi:AcrR family transcriptional regulator